MAEANIYQREGRTIVDFREPILREGHHEDVWVEKIPGGIHVTGKRVEYGWLSRWNEYSDKPDPDLVEDKFIETVTEKSWPWSKPKIVKQIKQGHFRYKERVPVQYEANNYLIIT